MTTQKVVDHLAQHHGEPVILTARGGAFDAAVLRHIQHTLNELDYLCLDGPRPHQLVVFDLAVDLT